jgi:hypothetical protein
MGQTSHTKLQTTRPLHGKAPNDSSADPKNIPKIKRKLLTQTY